ncbi:hypothetical protein NE237_029235 [Protea cynaroides]|uniref:Uncharacterized protein n=1 Tax=Protea cynaroides TaxID=273540 RepID=A0A9Q0GTJ2_9MAGN|nr:hypothetical protein NE237_029235 [Protea cynaroides]
MLQVAIGMASVVCNDGANRAGGQWCMGDRGVQLPLVQSDVVNSMVQKNSGQPCGTDQLPLAAFDECIQSFNKKPILSQEEGEILQKVNRGMNVPYADLANPMVLAKFDLFVDFLDDALTRKLQCTKPPLRGQVGKGKGQVKSGTQKDAPIGGITTRSQETYENCKGKRPFHDEREQEET